MNLIWEGIVLIICAFFSLLAIIISLIIVSDHLRNFTRPSQQRCIVRIILMVPLYSMYSTLALAFLPYESYFAFFRDAYEAYALYMFFVLCCDYAGGKEKLILSLLQQRRQKYLIPMCCFSFQPNGKFLRRCQQGILQYAILRPIVSLLCVILLSLGKYSEGTWSFSDFYPYATFLNNIGVTVSLYYLAQFYKVAREDLAPYKPVLKFGAIKLIVFFCYWQSVGISILVALNLLPTFSDFDEGQVSSIIQNVLICVEMFFFSILHIYAFPASMYRLSAQTKVPFVHDFELGGDIIKAVKNATNQRDMVDDAIESFVPKPTVVVTEEEMKKRLEKGRILNDAAEEPISEPPHPEMYIQTEIEEEEEDEQQNKKRIIPDDVKTIETSRK